MVITSTLSDRYKRYDKHQLMEEKDLITNKYTNITSTVFLQREILKLFNIFKTTIMHKICDLTLESQTYIFKHRPEQGREFSKSTKEIKHKNSKTKILTINIQTKKSSKGLNEGSSSFLNKTKRKLSYKENNEHTPQHPPRF